jgi:hypothetical protein
MKKFGKSISKKAIEEVRSYLEQVFRERGESTDSDCKPSGENDRARKPLDYYSSGGFLAGLTILSGRTTEVLSHDGNWYPVRFNQEGDFDDTELEDCTFKSGDWADEN